MKWAENKSITMTFLAAYCIADATVNGAEPAKVAATVKPTYLEVLATSTPADWRPLDLDNTLYMDLPQGRIVIELSPAYAPLHAANIKVLVREGYFDGLSILRSQDNYVVQWGDPDEKNPRPMKTGKNKLVPEYTRKIDAALPFTRLPDVDGYAKEVGFSNGFPVGRDAKTSETWLTHCYGMVGAGRDVEDDSGSGAELYAITGHAPRQLDRNIALVGRVLQGMPLLSVIPRGPGAMGFFDKAEARVPIKTVRIAADVPRAERTELEMIRTDTPFFSKLVESLRNRGGTWFKRPAGHVELCNVQIAVRAVVGAGGSGAK